MPKKPISNIPPVKDRDGISHEQIDHYGDGNIIRTGITLNCTILDLKTGKSRIKKMKYFLGIEPRDFRKGCNDPYRIYTIVHGFDSLIRRNGELYYGDLYWFSLGCKGTDHEHQWLVTRASVENYGNYIFWEPGVSDPEQHFKFKRKCKFNPEEVVRFNKDMAALFRVAKKNRF